MPASNAPLPDDTTTRLVEITYFHAAEGCGQRIPSPHESCQRAYAPFLAGERLTRRHGVVIVVCNACRAAWREVAA